jgi:hypothetical protein
MFQTIHIKIGKNIKITISAKIKYAIAIHYQAQLSQKMWNLSPIICLKQR